MVLFAVDHSVSSSIDEDFAIFGDMDKCMVPRTFIV
eukprot:CAMPEP_0184696674 /NCGR_PEP_ID=MMETSP0313-20130426/3892_1 /TAXON_ID=2792 /ORGANISM="Porphyridium aerugineum, Strain SAG 1380-2" /LENGTH=35 /DNA_ID= /DNA_START= /DNA_END= /DNA_ORIENTATION=